MADDDAPPKRRQPRRKLGWFWKLLIVTAVLLAIAPYIIAHTPLREAVLQTALKKMNGTVHCNGMSLSWWSPVSLSELTLKDANDQNVLQVGKLETSLALWQFLFNPSDLGTIRIERPVLNLEANNQTTNLEQMFAPLMEPTTEPSAPRDIRVEIVEGQLSIRDTVKKSDVEYSRTLPGND